MAQQGTDEKQGEDRAEASSGESSEESTGKHASTDAAETTETKTTEAETAADTSAGSSAEQTSQQESEAAPAASQKVEQAPAEKKTEQATQRTSGQQSGAAARGQADTSWAEEEPKGRRSGPSVDVGEVVWRVGNVLATVLRAIALLFALILVVNVVLVLVGVNPVNGVARFFAGVSDTVILGFRDLFLSADPTIMLIVNSLVAAAFWAFVGELASRLIRFLAARVK